MVRKRGIITIVLYFIFRSREYHPEELRRELFDGTVRIHEGVFFLSFYKEAHRMLFTNRIVTIRERGRSDSVTLDCARSNRGLVERGTKAHEILLERFGADMKKYDCKVMLQDIYEYLFDNYLLLEEYQKISNLKHLFATEFYRYIQDSKKTKMLTVAAGLHVGATYRWLLQTYLFVKYKIFNYRIQ